MADVRFDAPIGLNPQFSIHVVADRQVLLLSEQRSFRLTGKLYVSLVPYLDGSRTGDEIVAAFAGRAPEERVRFAIENMLKKDYAGPVAPAAPRGRQALWIELGLNPAEAEARLAASRIAIRPVGPDVAIARMAEAFGEAMADLGLVAVAEDKADIVVVVTDDYLRRDLAATNREMRAAGRSWLPLKPGGSEPLFGPLFGPACAPCWACLTKKMLENRPGDRLLGPEIAAVRPAQAVTLTGTRLATHFAALELARAIASGADKPALADHVLSVSLKTRAVREHPVRLEPHCPVCGTAFDAASVLARASEPLAIATRPLSPYSDGGWRVFPAEQVEARLARYVSPITGLIADVEDASPAPGLPVFQARQTNPVHVSPRQNRRVGRPGASAGKGASVNQARVSCLAEAIERYCCGWTGYEPRRRATLAELGDAAYHPHALLNYSERQYASREEWNKGQDGFNWVGEPFDVAPAIEWTPAWSLSRQATRWLPTRFCYFDYVDDVIEDEAVNRFCMADSNGCASGSTIEEAILQGFFELIERDACGLWWYNRVRRPAFDLSRIDDAFVARSIDHLRSRGRGVEVLDLTNDTGIPVAIALSHRLSDGGAITMGLGAHLDARIAVSRAVSELNQMAALEVDLDKADATGGDDATMLRWLREATLETEGYCVPDGQRDINFYAPPRIADLRDAIDLCVRRMDDLGFETIVLDHSRPEIDFSTARVVVPGLRHFWARFREGRLYQAPVSMGWLPAARDEGDLNPTPFFL